MNDKIRMAMMRPDCIMGVTPDNGGSWLSPITADSPQPTTLPATEGQPWAIGSGMLKPNDMEELFVFPGNMKDCRCGTALDFRGNANSFTMLAAVEFDDPPEQTKRWYPSFMSQGYGAGGTGLCTVNLGAHKELTGDWILDFGLYMDDSKNARLAYTVGDEIYGRHIIAGVRNVADNSFAIYFDGAAVKSNTNANVSLPLLSTIGASYNPDWGVCIGTGFNNLNFTYEGVFRIHAAAVFNYAMSAEEIAALS